MSDQPKRLYRSRSDRMIFGVCGGLGKYLNIDATVIRVLYVLASLIFGFFLPGAVVYLILMFIIPEEPLASEPQPPAVTDIQA
jgi:phage shock protein C